MIWCQVAWYNYSKYEHATENYRETRMKYMCISNSIEGLTAKSLQYTTPRTSYLQRLVFKAFAMQCKCFLLHAYCRVCLFCSKLFMLPDCKQRHYGIVILIITSLQFVASRWSYKDISSIWIYDWYASRSYYDYKSSPKDFWEGGSHVGSYSQDCHMLPILCGSTR